MVGATAIQREVGNNNFLSGSLLNQPVMHRILEILCRNLGASIVICIAIIVSERIRIGVRIRFSCIGCINSIVIANNCFCTVEMRCGHSATISATNRILNIRCTIIGIGKLKQHAIIQEVVDLDRPADFLRIDSIVLKTGVTGKVSSRHITERSKSIHR